MDIHGYVSFLHHVAVLQKYGPAALTNRSDLALESGEATRTMAESFPPASDLHSHGRLEDTQGSRMTAIQVAIG